jgi:hypothetical protein
VGRAPSLRNEFPDLADELDEESWPGVLHIETGCFARYACAAIDSQDQAHVVRCFDFAGRAWAAGDSDVQNALGVSFSEHLNFEDEKVPRAWTLELLAGVSGAPFGHSERIGAPRAAIRRALGTSLAGPCPGHRSLRRRSVGRSSATS